MKQLMPPIDTSSDNTFHDGNPLTGELGTIVSALFMNNVQGVIRNLQSELINVMKEAGVDVDDSNESQVLSALQKLFLTQSLKSLATEDLNTITTPGRKFQSAIGNAMEERNYPVEATGMLDIIKTSETGIRQAYYPSNSSSVYHRFCDDISSVQPVFSKWEDAINKLSASSGAFSVGFLRESVYSGSVGEYLHKAVLYLTPEMFGALGDGISDDRKAIQDAIDKANEIFLTSGKMVDLYIAGFHLVKLNPNSLGIGGEVAAGRGVLCIKPGVRICGFGTIKLDPSFSGGSSGAIITNWAGPVDNCTIQDITLDGSYGESSGSGITAINIVDSENVTISGARIINSTSGGVYLRKSSGSSGDYGCKNSKIIGCNLNKLAYIGIQCEKPNGVIISQNTINESTDNSIDIEGNNSSSTTVGFSERIIISNNSLSSLGHGIFLESCGNAIISGNSMKSKGDGIISNRINSSSAFNQITNNTISAYSGDDASSAIRFINSVGGTAVFGNFIKNKHSAFKFESGIDGLDIGVNYLTGISTFIFNVAKYASSLVRSRLGAQFVYGNQAEGKPYTTSPRNSPGNYPARMSYRVSYSQPHFSEIAGNGEDNMVYKTGVLQLNSTWSGYAVYTSGNTVLNGSLGSAGEFLAINGKYYKISSVTASETTVTKWDGTGYTPGDFTSDFDLAYAYSTHRAEWGNL